MVEYPLRAVEVADLGDGRTAGVGLLVGRNMDRGDAAKLPPEQLDLCEIEPLRQEEPGSIRCLFFIVLRGIHACFAAPYIDGRIQAHTA